jgi:hypothetical protein
MTRIIANKAQKKVGHARFLEEEKLKLLLNKSLRGKRGQEVQISRIKDPS